MSVLSNFFGYVLSYIYHFVSQIGVEPAYISYFSIAILTMTIFYKVVTLPITLSTIKMQKINAKMAPEMKKLQNKYKNDPATMQKKMAELQKEHNYNPFSGCLPIIIQLILVFALFRVMRNPGIYMFPNDAATATTIAKNFFWIPDLTIPDKILWGLPLINGITQYLLFVITQSSQGAEVNEQMQSMNTTMKYVMPIMIFITARSFTAGLALYWAFGNILEILFRLILKAKDNKEGAAA